MQIKIAIIGGGAAGFLAAVSAARNGADVTILERKDRVLKKVLATGNGRCNYTNIYADTTNYYGKNPEFTESVLRKFTPNDTIEFFEKLGIIHNIEEKGKVYPLSGQASSVVDALRLEAEKSGITIYTDFNVNKVQKTKTGFKIYSDSGNSVISDKIILAAGGKSYAELGSNGSGFELAKMLGHSITELKPALVQLKTEKEPIKGLQGIKVDTKITAFHKDKKTGSCDGELLFTDYGISGPVIFNLSYLTALYNNLIFSVDFMPKYDHETLLKMLKERRENLAHLTMENFFNGALNKKLGQLISKRSGVEKLSLPVRNLSDENIRKLTELIKNYKIKVLETTGFKNAQVTAGGILTEEINNETLESKKVKDIYFAGEVLDIFGDCGGYNLQWAWATGYLAGRSASSKK